MLKAKFEAMPNGCGVLNVTRMHAKPQYLWKLYPDSYGPFHSLKDGVKSHKSNAGFMFTAFAMQDETYDEEKKEWNKGQKAAYHWFAKHYPILYQSPVRLNKNTGHEFFFCVFDILNPF